MLQVNDTVRLITLEAQECESYFGKENIGWLGEEPSQPQVGETFEVLYTDKNGWIKCEGLDYWHPASKFEKVTPKQ